MRSCPDCGHPNDNPRGVRCRACAQGLRPEPNKCLDCGRLLTLQSGEKQPIRCRRHAAIESGRIRRESRQAVTA